MKKYFSLFIFALLFFYSIPFVTSAALNMPPNNNGLVGYWSMNEGTGTIAHDFSGNGDDGSLNGATWASGKNANAIQVNGGTTLTTNNSSVFDMSQNDRVTVSAWVKRQGNGTDSTWEGLVSRWNWPGSMREFLLTYHTGGGFRFIVTPDGSTETYVSSGVFPTNNQWYHVVGVADGSNLHMYINGVEQGTPAAYTGNIYYNSSQGLRIGDGGVTSQNWNGLIDEVRVYNRALSATEIKALYNSGTTKLITSTNTKITNGLIGLWSFDSNDVSATSSMVYDRSGNSHHGNVVNGLTSIFGRVGQAMQFSGSYITLPTQPFNYLSGDLTITGWIRLASTGILQTIVSQASGISNVQYHSQFRVDASNKLNVYFYDSVTTPPNPKYDCSGSTTLSANVWYYATWVHDTTGNRIYLNGNQESLTANSGDCTADYSLGDNGSGNDRIGVLDAQDKQDYFYGNMDDLRAYNRALSVSEIKQLYQAGLGTKVNTQTNNKSTNGLINLWSFDGQDVSGSTAYDRVGANNGTISGPTPTIGKIGQALKFNGSTQSVTISNVDLTSIDSTVSLWIKPTVLDSALRSIITNSSWADGLVTHNGTLKLGFGAPEVGTLSTGVWQHVVVRVVSGTSEIFINGVSVGNSSNWAHVTNIIGNDQFNENFVGDMDDIRFYNRALSNSEITQLYRQGK